MNITIDGEMNACTFMGCSDDERAGFQSIIVKVKPIFSKENSKENIKEWLAETERRCPVTDNIKEGTQIEIDDL
ncbi:MAG: OsmC family protein [Bacteroidales bacterium]|nr:OsmC family protein [Bacteroidales bacterium]